VKEILFSILANIQKVIVLFQGSLSSSASPSGRVALPYPTFNAEYDSIGKK
jgi:hypothetical protein